MSSYFDTIKLESQLTDTANSEDFDNQLTDAGNSQDFDCQLIIAKSPTRSVPLTISTVLSLPPGLPSIRQQAFNLNTQLIWTAEKFAQYWPFVDNIWVHNHTESLTKKRIQKLYWYCRI